MPILRSTTPYSLRATPARRPAVASVDAPIKKRKAVTKPKKAAAKVAVTLEFKDAVLEFVPVAPPAPKPLSKTAIKKAEVAARKAAKVEAAKRASVDRTSDNRTLRSATSTVTWFFAEGGPRLLELRRGPLTWPQFPATEPQRTWATVEEWQADTADETPVPVPGLVAEEPAAEEPAAPVAPPPPPPLTLRVTKTECWVTNGCHTWFFDTLQEANAFLDGEEEFAASAWAAWAEL